MNSTLFKKILHKQSNHNLLHHIAEEELISCKVNKIDFHGMQVHFICACNDKPRDIGPQQDLTEKLQERLNMHKFAGVPRFKILVVHQPSKPSK